MQYFKQFLIAAFTIICLSASGQTDYLVYYAKVNKAESSICSSDFAAANKSYQEAFNVSPGKGFFIDLTNAFHAGMDSKEYALAQQYLSQLQDKGLDTFSIQKMLRPYSTDELKNIDTHRKIRRNPVSLYKKEQIESIKKLVQWDQEVRLYYSDLNNGDYMVDSVFRADTRIANSLLRIFQKYGLPDEALFNETRCNIIISHNTSGTLAGNTPHLFDTLLFKAMRALNYDARIFATLIERDNPGSSFIYKDFTIKFPLTISCASFDSLLYPEYYNDSSEKRIDAERAKIGLEPLADFRKKVEAINVAKKNDSSLLKYSLLHSVKVYETEPEDPEREAKFKEWMFVNGKDAPVKKPLLEIPDKMDQIGMGKIEKHVIGKTTFDELMAWYKTFNTEYYQEQTPYMNRKDRAKKLNWNYHTEFVVNNKEDVCTDTGRNNAALFVDGYKMIGTDGYHFETMALHSIEMLFKDQLLIYYSAQIKTGMYNTFLYFLGPASSINVTIRKEKFKTRPKELILLKTKKTLWIGKNLNSELTVTEFLDPSGKVRTQTIYSMYQVDAYNAYLQKVALKRDSLDKHCREIATGSSINKKATPGSK